MYEAQKDTDKFGNKGYGMGLAIVKELVENLGGSITLKSTEGVDSTFMFTITK